MILGWYLVGGCIIGQRCVAQKNRVDVTFDLDPVTLKPKLPSAVYLLIEWRFFVDIWWEDVSGDKGVSLERFVSMRPLTLTQNCIIIPFRSVSPKRMKILGWYLVWDVSGGLRCVARKIRVDVTFDLETEIPFCSVSPKRMKIFGWYLVGGCIRGQRYVLQKIHVNATFDLNPVTLKPKLSSAPSPKRMKICDWYLVGGCIRGQRCVPQKIHVDATFDLHPVTLKPKFPSSPNLLSERKCFIDIWWQDEVGGGRYVAW
jgi:hypothetical protein